MLQIRKMEVSDVEDASVIVAAHSKIDGKLAAEYYTNYFADPQRLSSDRERNFVGICDDSIVGVVGFCFDKYCSPDILWLNWFYVHPNYRRRGIGRDLLKYVLDEARSLGVRKMYLDTSSDISYAPAVALYERFGFREEGRLLDYYGHGEHYLIMGLVL